jgi:hypothetical protein
MSDLKFLELILAFRIDLARILGVRADRLSCSDAWNDFTDPFVKGRADQLRAAYRTQRKLFRDHLAMREALAR